MVRPLLLLLMLATLLLAGCSTTNDVVGKGLIQKRKYRPGWDLSSLHVGQHTRERQMIKRTTEVLPERIQRRWSEPLIDVQPAAPLTASRGIDNGTLQTTPSSTRPSPELSNVNKILVKATSLPSSMVPGDPTITGERRWNRIAITSGIFLLLSAIILAVSGGAPVLFYLLSIAFIMGVIGLILAIKHNERGKLIAIAAIAFPLAIMILAIASLGNL